MFNGKIHYKWPFSIAMLVHQRVTDFQSFSALKKIQKSWGDHPLRAFTTPGWPRSFSRLRTWTASALQITGGKRGGFSGARASEGFATKWLECHDQSQRQHLTLLKSLLDPKMDGPMSSCRKHQFQTTKCVAPRSKFDPYPSMMFPLEALGKRLPDPVVPQIPGVQPIGPISPGQRPLSMTCRW